MKHLFATGVLLLFINSFCLCQERDQAKDSTTFYNMSLEELMNINVTVASQLPMTNRESPGIITIITQEEINNLGVNDIVDVLKHVPGFDFGVDVDGVVGIGVRGNWANEGKVLLLWDGIEMNEDLYSTLQFGKHYPIERIKRIEIIRGPGSAMYGGYAEYAVINIITMENSEFDGVFAKASNSFMSRTHGSRNLTLASGKTFGGVHMNLSASLTDATRSQETFSDYYGSSYDMSSQSSLADAQYRMDFFYKGLSATGLYDKYSVTQRDGYDQIYLRPYKTEFNSGNVNVKYELKASEKLTLTPGLKLKFQEPWKYKKEVNDDHYDPFHTTAKKREYYLNAKFDPTQKVNIRAGISYYHQSARQEFDTVFFSNRKQMFHLDNYSVFLQGIIKSGSFNVILGSRYEYSHAFGNSFVPRIGITKVSDNFHIKALYSTAFRTPSIANINASPDIQPEKTFISELEAGIKISRHSYLTANVFDITTDNPIVYSYDENEEDQYSNAGSTGTRGFEIEYKVKTERCYAAINYSYYTTAGHEPVAINKIPGSDLSASFRNQVLGFPAHKFNLNNNFRITSNININPSANFVSARYAYRLDENGDESSIRIRPSFYGDLSLNFEKIFCEGLSLQLSCLNITDEKIYFIQPYNGNHAPLPGASREYQLKIKYSFSFKGKK